MAGLKWTQRLWCMMVVLLWESCSVWRERMTLSNKKPLQKTTLFTYPVIPTEHSVPSSYCTASVSHSGLRGTSKAEPSHRTTTHQGQTSKIALPIRHNTDRYCLLYTRDPGSWLGHWCLLRNTSNTFWSTVWILFQITALSVLKCR